MMFVVCVLLLFALFAGLGCCSLFLFALFWVLVLLSWLFWFVVYCSLVACFCFGCAWNFGLLDCCVGFYRFNLLLGGFASLFVVCFVFGGLNVGLLIWIYCWV